MHNIGHKIILIRTICSISDTQIRPATRDTQCREHWNTIDKSRARYRKFCKKNKQREVRKAQVLFGPEGVVQLCGKIICLLEIYNIFRRHNNMVYLFNFNITYIIIFATCFDSYESSSGINFKN